MLNIICYYLWLVNAVPLQTKAVQQAMDQKDFHRAVELRGRSVVACWPCMFVCVYVCGVLRGDGIL